jgi:Ca-activated chloride channel family protein
MSNKKTNIEIITEKAKLIAGEDRTIDVLVRITPPQTDASERLRPKLNLSLVLDRSGSMQGRKMKEAKEAANFCIDQLLATDRISTVIFDTDIDILIPSQLVEEKERLKRAINSVRANSSTALHEAWVRGGLQVSEHLDTDAINRVLLITDGQANEGETNVERIVEQARQLAARGVSTSTIGIGQDFNEDLLMPMAEAGKGNSWHVEEPQDMVRIFDTELQGLVNQIGHSVTFGIKALNDAAVVDVLNDFEMDRSGRHILPDLQAGSPLDIAVRLKVPAFEAGTQAELADFNVTYIDQEIKIAISEKAVLNIGFDQRETISELPLDGRVGSAVQMLMNARARREAVNKMDESDYAGAAGALGLALRDTDIAFAKISTPQLAAEMDDLRELGESLKSRQNDSLSRKRMAYRREMLRKSK